MPSAIHLVPPRLRLRRHARVWAPRQMEMVGQSAGVTATFTLSASAQAGAAPPPSGQAGAAGGVNNTLNGTTAAGTTLDIAAYLKQFCLPGTACSNAAQTAANAFDKLGPTAAQAAQLMGSGNTAAGAAVAAPIIAGALGGAIGGPAGAAVAAAVVTGLESVFTSLFGSSSYQPGATVTCDYRVGFGDGSSGYVCFHSTERPPGPTDPTGQPDSRWLTMEEFQAGNSAKLGKQTVSWQTVNSQDHLSGQYNSGDIHDSARKYQLTWPYYAFQFWGGVGQPTGTNPNMPSYQASWNAGFVGTMSALGIKLPGTPDALLNQPSQYATTPVWLFNRPAVLIDPTAFQQTLAQLKLSRSDMITNSAAFTANAAGAAMSLTPPVQAAVNNIAAFIKVYCQAFYRGVCERFINNWQVDANFPVILLEATVQAWNAAHEDTVQYTFDYNKGAIVSFVDAVIQNFVVLPGQTGANGGYSQTINIGPVKAPPAKVPPKLMKMSGSREVNLLYNTAMNWPVGSPSRAHLLAAASMMAGCSAGQTWNGSECVSTSMKMAPMATKPGMTALIAPPIMVVEKPSAVGFASLVGVGIALAVGMPWVAVMMLGTGATVGAIKAWVKP